MTKLEQKRLEAEWHRVQAAKAMMEIEKEECLERIEILDKNIKIQEEKEKELKGKLVE